MQFSEKDGHHRGEYKKTSNSVAALDENGKQIGIVFETAAPFGTPRLMTELIEWRDHAQHNRQLHPLLAISVFIVVFLAIHPFQDGNGRLSRILTTLMLLQAGYAYVPYSSLESVIEQSKETYYLGLCQTQGTLHTEKPDWQPWILFFLRALQQQKKHLAGKVEREKIVLSNLPELSVQILDYARQHGRVSIGEMVKISGANRNTLKQHFRAFVEKGHLVLHAKGRSAWCSLA